MENTLLKMRWCRPNHLILRGVSSYHGMRTFRDMQQRFHDPITWISRVCLSKILLVEQLHIEHLTRHRVSFEAPLLTLTVIRYNSVINQRHITPFDTWRSSDWILKLCCISQMNRLVGIHQIQSFQPSVCSSAAERCGNGRAEKVSLWGSND
jgi:hypothetical protein